MPWGRKLAGRCPTVNADSIVSLRQERSFFGQFFFLAVFLVLLTFPLQAATIHLAADSWCPYNCAPESGQPGYVVELATNIFSRAGLQVDYQRLNWSRSILMARQGKLTGIIGATRQEAPGLIYADEPVGISINTFWTRVGSSWLYTGPHSLDQLQVGIIQDYDYGEVLNSYLNKKIAAHVHRAFGETASETNIKRLNSGWLDVVIEDKAVFRYQAEKMNRMSRFRYAGREEPRGDDCIYLAFSPADPKAEEYARIFSEGVRAMRASGELADMLAKYGLVDWKKQ